MICWIFGKQILSSMRCWRRWSSMIDFSYQSVALNSAFSCCCCGCCFCCCCSFFVVADCLACLLGLACLFGLFAWLACFLGLLAWLACVACLLGLLAWLVCLACFLGLLVLLSVWLACLVCLLGLGWFGLAIIAFLLTGVVRKAVLPFLLTGGVGKENFEGRRSRARLLTGKWSGMHESRQAFKRKLIMDARIMPGLQEENDQECTNHARPSKII